MSVTCFLETIIKDQNVRSNQNFVVREKIERVGVKLTNLKLSSVNKNYLIKNIITIFENKTKKTNNKNKNKTLKKTTDIVNNI